MSKKQAARSLIKWFENTMLSPDVIFKHFGVPKKEQEQLLLMLLQARKEEHARWREKNGRQN